MNNKSYSEVFDAAAGNHIPDRTDLAPRILTHIQKGKGAFMQPKLKLITAILAVMTVFIILLANGPAVVHALQNLFGYIPGLGTVASDGSLRALAEPASQTKDGVTVTIQQGTIDSNRTILTMTVSGSTATKFNSDCIFKEAGTSNDPWLRLPDGTKVKSSTWTGTGVNRYDMRYYFPSLSDDITAVTIEIPCLIDAPSPENWEIPLRFETATGLNPSPVIEIDPAAPGAQSSGELYYGILMTMTLEQVVPLEDGYLLLGNLKWGDGTGVLNNILDISPDSIQVVDANGDELVSEWVVPDKPDPEVQIHEKQSWAFKVSGKDHAWPLTLTFVNVQVESMGPAYSPFTFDPGPDPRVGQTWALDQDVKNYTTPIYTVHLNSVEFATDPDSGNPGIVFDLQTHPDVLALQVEDINENLGFSSLHSNHVQPGHLSTGFVFLDGRLSGKREFAFTGITLLVQGNWQVTWQP